MSDVTVEPPIIDDAEAELPPGQRIAKKPFRRLLLGQTAVDFWGRRRVGMFFSLALILISIVSLTTRGLNLGIDFVGGVAYDVPAGEVSPENLRAVLDDQGLQGSDAKVEERQSSSGDIIKVTIGDQPADVRVAVQEALAARAGVDPADVSVASVSSSWGEQITEKAIIALIVFILLIAVVISIRFEWRMAVAAILAMLHDVLISAGIYSVFGFEVTPPTVIAFLTILGYSLYDTIVVFDRVKENERRVVAAGLSAADLVNVSSNQVLLRSLNTSISAVLPVISLLVIGSWMLGQVTLQEFAIALLIGMLTGAYSSIFVATPVLGMLKGRGNNKIPHDNADHLTGESLRTVVVRGVGVLTPASGRRRRGTSRAPAPATAASESSGTPSTRSSPVATDATTEQLLSHPARPRKKKRH
jgi:preprotein translocase subunit SecF